jgi:SP family sugar:H+ symporter-like MFS transporter
VQANHLYEMSLGKSTYIDCFKGTVGKRLLTGCLLQSLQQLTGVNFICEYILVDASEHALTKSSLLRNPVLQERGFPGSVRHLSHHQLCQCVLHISRTISSREDGTSQLASHGCHWHGFLSMYVLVYHLPGKRALTHLLDVVAITGTVAGTTNLPAQRASIAFVCIYIFFFASSWGPVAW